MQKIRPSILTLAFLLKLRIVRFTTAFVAATPIGLIASGSVRCKWCRLVFIVLTHIDTNMGFHKLCVIFGTLTLLHAAYSAAQRKYLYLYISNYLRVTGISQNSELLSVFATIR